MTSTQVKFNPSGAHEGCLLFTELGPFFCYVLVCDNLISDLQVPLLHRKGQEYTKQQREFALTLHLHGPKAYMYLRDSQHLPLPHPSTLQ